MDEKRGYGLLLCRKPLERNMRPGVLPALLETRSQNHATNPDLVQGCASRALPHPLFAPPPPAPPHPLLVPPCLRRRIRAARCGRTARRIRAARCGRAVRACFIPSAPTRSRVRALPVGPPHPGRHAQACDAERREQGQPRHVRAEGGRARGQHERGEEAA